MMTDDPLKPARTDELPLEGVGNIRPHLEELGEVEVLRRIRALAPQFENRDLPDETAVFILTRDMELGEARVAKTAHGVLRKSAMRCLESCGYVEPDNASMLLLLKVFANLNGWEFQEMEWIEC
jgi:hypothetical protein